MADYNINAVTRKVSYTGSAGVGPYAFSFEVLTQTDLAVYFNATLLTLTTDYTVTINANGTGSITIVTGTNVPTTPDADDTIVIIGSRDIERTTDFVTAGDLRASSLNEQLDSAVIFDQQISERVDRSISAPAYDPTGINMTLPAKADRANSFLNFDANGDVSTSNLTGLTSLTIDNIKIDGNTISTLDGSGELIINADLSSSSVRTVIHQPHLQGTTNGTRIDGVFKNSADETTAILGGGSSQFIYYNGTSVFSTEALGIRLDGNGDVADGATLDLLSGATSGNVANDDIIGTVKFTGQDKNVVSTINTWADIRAQLTDATANQEDSKIIFRVNNAGTLTEAASLDSTASNGNRLEVRNSATNYVRIDSNPARISALQALTLQSAGDSGSQIIIQTGLSGNIDLSPAGAGQVDVNSDLNVVGTIEFDGLSGTGATTVTDILDEDNMASNSATALATQQSIKAYVDTTVAATNELVEDLTPQLGGNLDLNSNDITGTGNIDVTGTVTADGLTVDSSSSVISTFNGTAATGINVSIKNTEHEFYIGTNDGNLYLYDVDNTATRFNIASNGDISFYEDTGTTAKFFWDASAESLGIGTTSPSTNLEISDDDVELRLTDTSGGYSDIRYAAGVLQIRADQGNNVGSSSMRFSVDGSEAMRIDSSGNVGIGVTPYSWGGAGVTALDIGTVGSLSGSASDTGLSENAYYNGSTWVYKTTSAASLYQQLAGSHRFSYAASGTAGASFSFSEAMRIDSSGNVGIGDTPQSFSKLQVKTDTNKQIAMFSNANGATVGGITDVGGSTTLRLAGSPLVMTGAGGAGSEAMRIDANGHVTIGRTSTASSATDFGHNFYATGQLYINSSSSGNSDVIRGYDSSGANTFAIDGDGDYINLSDQRKKENIADIQIGLAEVMQLQPRQFDWIDSGEHVPSGFVAQEVHSIIPSAVVENDDGFLMMKDRQLIPVLTKALQEAVARIETLEAEVATLKGS